MADKIGPLLALEEQLQQDGGGALRDRLRDEFAQGASRIKRILNGGVTPAEVQSLSKLVAAYDAAGTVVEEVWRRTHSGSGPGLWSR